jgi:F-type H+-transporting ATPase subunit gamma
MSDTLATLRRKIAGARQLESVVRVMKALAASSIGQYEAALLGLGDYQRHIEIGLGACLRDGKEAPRIASRAAQHTIGAIVFGSDQGLVGQFNEVIANFTVRTLAALPGKKVIWAVGERVFSHFVDVGLQPIREFSVPGSVNAITPLVQRLQIESEPPSPVNAYSEIYIFNNRPQSTSQYAPAVQRLLPLDSKWRARLIGTKWPGAILPQVFGDNDVALTALVHEYLFISLYKACAESLASENGSRLAAMERAHRNISVLAKGFERSFYRLRQNSIDEELFDVIAGFEALSGTPTTASNPKRLS